MKKILATSGIFLVSSYMAEYYVYKSYDLYVFNRNIKE